MTGQQKFILALFALGCMLALCLAAMFAPVGGH